MCFLMSLFTATYFLAVGFFHSFRCQQDRRWSKSFSCVVLYLCCIIPNWRRYDASNKQLSNDENDAEYGFSDLAGTYTIDLNIIILNFHQKISTLKTINSSRFDDCLILGHIEFLKLS